MRGHLKKKALVLVGHGSRHPGFQRAMKRVASRLDSLGQFSHVICAYLEVTRPSISSAIESCVRKGAREIVVAPYFVLTGAHVAKDIPLIVRKAAGIHKTKTRIKLAPYLGYDDRIVSVVRKRIREAQWVR
jgi:sirohydrochlorin cobaltochelatase